MPYFAPRTRNFEPIFFNGVTNIISDAVQHPLMQTPRAATPHLVHSPPPERRNKRPPTTTKRSGRAGRRGTGPGTRTLLQRRAGSRGTGTWTGLRGSSASRVPWPAAHLRRQQSRRRAPRETRTLLTRTPAARAAASRAPATPAMRPRRPRRQLYLRWLEVEARTWRGVLNRRRSSVRTRLFENCENSRSCGLIVLPILSRSTSGVRATPPSWHEVACGAQISLVVSPESTKLLSNS